MPLQATSGAASYDGFGGGVAAVPNYIEDVFSTYLYTGNGSTQTITNGIDLSTKGGLVWSKSRSNIENNVLLDTIRGPNNILVSNSTAAGSTSGTPYVTATTTGYSIGTSNNQINGSGLTYASWTFRKQPKFFDVVTYTGSGTAQNISHSLGSVPGCIIIKKYNGTAGWALYHRSLGNDRALFLNSTFDSTTWVGAEWWNNTTPTSTQFTVGSNDAVNNSGGVTYVAYIYAHNAGGFGLTGTDNVISCGTYTGTGAAGNTINCGFEPQFILAKNANNASATWYVCDMMRDGFVAANSANAEAGNGTYFNYSSSTSIFAPTPTGFIVNNTGPFVNGSGNNIIYIAIRRGPMKVPTDATKVFVPVTYTGDGAASRAVTTGFVSDVVWTKSRSNATEWMSSTLLAGTQRILIQNTTDAEVNVSGYFITAYNNTGFTFGTAEPRYNTNARTYVVEGFSRAPSFMDVVCYTGTGANRTVSHNLGVVPELMIIKSRSSGLLDWIVYNTISGNTQALLLNTADAVFTSSAWNNTTPTSTVFSTGATSGVNNSGETFVAYLFATCAGVSKVGSYTGNGSTQTINCGFTGGARFILIKASSAAGSWRVYDTARGINAGNDPELFLNLTNVEQTVYDAIDTASTGFIVNSNAANVNDNGTTYIFLAIA
jgi:hypothetical protein